MVIRRFDVVFDLYSSGSVWIEDPSGRSEPNYMLKGEGSVEDKINCGRALRFYELGAKHKMDQIKGALGIR